MELALRSWQSVGYQRLNGISGPIQYLCELLAFGRVEWSQDIVGGILAPRRPTDPNTEPIKLRCSKGLLCGPDAVVPTGPAANLEPQGTKGDVDIVVDHDDLLGWDSCVISRRFDRATGFIHEGPGPKQDRSMADQATFSGVSMGPLVLA